MEGKRRVEDERGTRKRPRVMVEETERVERCKILYIILLLIDIYAQHIYLCFK